MRKTLKNKKILRRISNINLRLQILHEHCNKKDSLVISEIRKLNRTKNEIIAELIDKGYDKDHLMGEVYDHQNKIPKVEGII